MSTPRPFRAEHIGSLLRPPDLLRARDDFAAGTIDRERLTAAENEAIRNVVQLQEDVGLKVITDGEFRRGTYSDSFTSDLVAAYHEEMRSLADVGCTYLQIDETSLVKLGDPRVQTLLKERGDDWRDLLKTYIGAVNAVVAGAPPGMTIGIHICRSQ